MLTSDPQITIAHYIVHVYVTRSTRYAAYLQNIWAGAYFQTKCISAYLQFIRPYAYCIFGEQFSVPLAQMSSSCAIYLRFNMQQPAQL